MPLYEYVCQDCAREIEVLQRVKMRPLKICPHCGGRLKKVFSAPAIHFKGSGWYITDYARAKKPEMAAAPSKAESESKPAEPKSVEAKPAESKSAESKPAESKGEKSEAKRDSKESSKRNS